MLAFFLRYPLPTNELTISYQSRNRADDVLIVVVELLLGLVVFKVIVHK